MKKLLGTLFLLLCFFLAFAQNSDSSKVNITYYITGRYITDSHAISADEKIIFINKYNRTLKYVYVYLWPNAYNSKHSLLAKQLANFGQTQLIFHFKKSRGFLDSMNFVVNNTHSKVIFRPKKSQIAKLILPKPLKHGDTAIIQTHFYFKLPFHVGETGYSKNGFVLYNWFPRLAAIDSSGWHLYQYSQIGTPYFNFANFFVSITLPKQYVIASTGQIVSKKEKQWLNDLSFNGLKGQDYPNPSSDSLYKTVNIKALNVNNFAISASPFYYVIKSHVTLKNNQTITTWAFFTDKNILTWLQSANFLDTSTVYLSNWIGPYPYKQTKIAQNPLLVDKNFHAPQLSVISENVKNSENLQIYTFNYSALGWFQAILGSDGYKCPYITQGLASFYTNRFQRLKHIGFLFTNPNPEILFLAYNTLSYLGYDKPLLLDAKKYNFTTYLNTIYLKSIILTNHFFNYANSLKYNLFDSTMNAYYDQYKFKRPNISQLHLTFANSMSPHNTEWFFNTALKKNRKIDYKIRINHRKITIKATHSALAPMHIVLSSPNAKLDTSFWTQPKRKIKIPNSLKFTHAFIDPAFKTADFNRYNNFSRTGLLFKSKASITPNILFAFKPYQKTALSLFPAVFYRKPEKWLFGIIINNFSFPLKKSSFALIPFYSPQMHSFFGLFYGQIQTLGTGIMPDINLSLYLDRFSWAIPSTFIPKTYRNLKLKINLRFHSIRHNDIIGKNLTLIYQNVLTPFNLTLPPNELNYTTPQFKTILSAKLRLYKKSPYHPWTFTANLNYLPKQNVFIPWILLVKKFHYTSLNTGLTLRFFLGKNVLLSGATAQNDFDLRYPFLFRTLDYKQNIHNPLAHQFQFCQGGFAYYSYNFVFDKLLTSFSVFSTPPIKKLAFINAYASVAFGKFINHDFNLPAQNIFYEYGLRLNFSFVQFFIPLGGTFKQLNNDIDPHWYWHIRFSFGSELSGFNLEKIIKFKI